MNPEVERYYREAQRHLHKAETVEPRDRKTVEWHMRVARTYAAMAQAAALLPSPQTIDLRGQDIRIEIDPEETR